MLWDKHKVLTLKQTFTGQGAVLGRGTHNDFSPEGRWECSHEVTPNTPIQGSALGPSISSPLRLLHIPKKEHPYALARKDSSFRVWHSNHTVVNACSCLELEHKCL